VSGGAMRQAEQTAQCQPRRKGRRDDGSSSAWGRRSFARDRVWLQSRRSLSLRVARARAAPPRSRRAGAHRGSNGVRTVPLCGADVNHLTPKCSAVAGPERARILGSRVTRAAPRGRAETAGQPIRLYVSARSTSGGRV
jgi:hypothetical protein